ncbi:FAD-dependent oxidoreductase [Mesorhizobium sp. M4B.F.Ca.ET.190.01.1.1]|uniref:oxidoreductase n=1 Tax=unclassified Mesorhizobium TaxID=325217 RepID=UPI0010924FC8|nr:MULTISPECIES: FAD-dependent oxidoreductase [unclassified Mesorhizobium]TGR10536.1 FAD-dependent oxidoreductase [Mesorhizobium sp. M4B.F.Ca.ET.200.01.1.1]TGS19626.1 FAD-dependent oxidoreductase [Mesorhizobium sp. M4B.F.Ca.ET.190.01.1.1]TGT32408.1 FAD-dependent oxidoreductase [Mesorhizobium sp. M4B.F.Ca.ET.172.01.1.1]
MSEIQFTHLLSPLQLGSLSLRNRMIFTAHDSSQQVQGKVTEAYIAYQVARTKGGAGLQILAAASVDENSSYYDNQLMIDSDQAIPGLKGMADAVHAEGGHVFSQLLHSGALAAASSDGSRPLAYGASAVRIERTHERPRELSIAEIRTIVAKFGDAARRAKAAGMDGVEICASQGNLPQQFLAGSMNRRTDEYGGPLENRFRFLKEICTSIRLAVGEDYVVGLRLSADDMDHFGLEADEASDAMTALEKNGTLTYLHIVLGSGASKGGAIHIVPPMAFEAGYLFPFAEQVRRKTTLPLIVTGRFNTPHLADQAIGKGVADAVGMTRAMICDPQLAKKVEKGCIDDVRACIACDQACIGHLHKGVPVSCIQYPESGRELTLGKYPALERRKTVLVAGGGPAGMKAASVAAVRGHRVTLCEAAGVLGGQINIAARLPNRTEFGGLVTNLARELELANVEVRLRTAVDAAFVEELRPDALILAVGSRPEDVDVAQFGGMQVATAEDVILKRKKIGTKVVVADALSDWVAFGVCLELAAGGHEVTLATTGLYAGELIPAYVRDDALGKLFRAGVKIQNFARLFGADGDTVYFEHVTALEPIIFEGVDTLVVCTGNHANRALESALGGTGTEMYIIGDCLMPRSAEEAVLDGLKVGRLV